MSTEMVTVRRAKGFPSCRLWDQRLTHDDTGAPVPLPMPLANAADLLERDPAEWVVDAPGKTVVDAEVAKRKKAREDAAKAAAAGKE